MHIDEIEQFRQQLLKLRSEVHTLQAELKDAADTVVLDQTSVGRLSRMDAMQRQQMALESSRRRQSQLLKIEGALQRMASGKYGYCFICGEEINSSRLTFDPTNTRCMECSEK